LEFAKAIEKIKFSEEPDYKKLKSYLVNYLKNYDSEESSSEPEQEKNFYPLKVEDSQILANDYIDRLILKESKRPCLAKSFKPLPKALKAKNKKLLKPLNK
jgi:hypothetical protein